MSHLIKIQVCLVLLLVPVVVLGADSISNLIPCDGATVKCTFDHLITMVDNLIRFLIFNIGIILATLLILGGGIMYVLYPYKASYKENGKKMMTGAIVGLVIMMMSYVVVKFIVLGLVGESSNPVTGSNATLVSKIKSIFSDIPNTSQPK